MNVKKIILWLVLATLPIAALWLGFPHALALYHQIEGGKLLVQVLKTAYPEQADAIACTLEPLKDPAWRKQVNRAIGHLEKALDYDPGLAQAALLAGRGYCLLGEAGEAVRYYENYTSQKPANPNGYLELSFAQSLHNQPPEMIWQSITKAGIQDQDLHAAAKSAFFARKFQQARVLFSFGDQLDGLTQDETFLSMLTKIIISPASIPDEDLFPVYHLENSITIEAEDLIWVRENKIGIPLNTYPTGNLNWSVMWWNGAAVAVIHVLHPGTYHFLIRAQNTAPGSVNLDLEWNFQPVSNFSLTKEDGSWTVLDQEYDLLEGYQIVGLRFLNDEVVGGKNRNAILDWIKIEAITANR